MREEFEEIDPEKCDIRTDFFFFHFSNDEEYDKKIFIENFSPKNSQKKFFEKEFFFFSF